MVTTPVQILLFIALFNGELDLGLTKDDEVGDVLEEIDSRVSYTVEEGKVTATIKMEKAIEELPENWTYVTGTDNKQIQREYTSNAIEQVEIKDEDGKLTKIEVTVTQLGNGGGAGGAGGTGTSITTAITNDNIGDYIDLGNTIVGTTATDDDWRVLYVEDTNEDGVAEKVHVILADYLPNSTGHAATAGLSTENTDLNDGSSYVYSVYSTVDANDLVNKLKRKIIQF